MVLLFMQSEKERQLEELMAMFGNADLVPVVTRMPGDLLTPVAAYCALESRSKRSFLFESVEGGEHLARYSFIGSDPEFSVMDTGKGLNVGVDGSSEIVDQPILEFLRTKLHRRRIPKIDGLPYFLGGAVGFLDFEVSREIEPVLNVSRREKPGRAGSEFMFFREVVAFDHVKQLINIISLVFPEAADGDPRKFRTLITGAIDRNEETASLLSSGASSKRNRSTENVSSEDFRSNFTRSEFETAVGEVKELIAAGECYQVVLSQRFSRETAAAPVEIYRALRSLNPSPYMFLMNFGGRAVIGASPEMLVRCREGALEYRPIAGTRPRGANPREDAELADEMLADEKELAEHRMLVDLGRNDLGRVAEFGSVKVDELMTVEKFSHVQHIVSSVSATLKRDLSGFDALASCFPAGTVSGAPKVRAMEIIGELEPTERGVYSGAVGYFDYQENIDTCIAIRTIYLENGIAAIQAGAGIVADSIPEREYEETIHKATALMTAIRLAESGRFALPSSAGTREASK